MSSLVDIEAERQLRRQIMLELSAHLTERGETITRPELSNFPLGPGSSAGTSTSRGGSGTRAI